MIAVDEVFCGRVSVRISNDRFGDDERKYSSAISVAQLGKSMEKSHLDGLGWFQKHSSDNLFEIQILNLLTHL